MTYAVEDFAAINAAMRENEGRARVDRLVRCIEGSVRDALRGTINGPDARERAKAAALRVLDDMGAHDPIEAGHVGVRADGDTIWLVSLTQLGAKLLWDLSRRCDAELTVVFDPPPIELEATLLPPRAGP